MHDVTVVNKDRGFQPWRDEVEMTAEADLGRFAGSADGNRAEPPGDTSLPSRTKREGGGVGDNRVGLVARDEAVPQAGEDGGRFKDVHACNLATDAGEDADLTGCRTNAARKIHELRRPLARHRRVRPAGRWHIVGIQHTIDVLPHRVLVGCEAPGAADRAGDGNGLGRAHAGRQVYCRFARRLHRHRLPPPGLDA